MAAFFPCRAKGNPLPSPPIFNRARIINFAKPGYGHLKQDTMRQFEVTFIVDPVLSNEEIVATSHNYVDHLKKQNCRIVHVEEMGLRQLAYPINKRTSGVYYCIEFESENGNLIERLELALRRDERIMRFLSVKLDKYGIKYNEDKRNGLIGKKREEKEPAKAEATAAAPAPAATKTAPAATAPAAVAEAPAPVAETPAAPEASPAEEEE